MHIQALFECDLATQCRQQRARLMWLDIQVDIPTAPGIINTRAKQPYIHIRTKILGHRMKYVLALYRCQSHWIVMGKGTIKQMG